MPLTPQVWEPLFGGLESAPALSTAYEQWTYGALDDLSEQWAGTFQTHRIHKNHLVALVSDRYEDLYPALLGLWKQQAIPAVVPVGRTEMEFLQLLRPDFVVHFQPSLEIYPGENPGAVRPAATSLVLCTSGSRGVPKAVCLKAESLIENARLTGQRLGLSDQERLLLVTAPYYTSSIVHTFTVWITGGEVVAHPGFTFGAELLNKIQQENCTSFGGAPVHLIRVLDASNKPLPPTLKLWLTSGDYLSPHYFKMAQERFPNLKVVPMYGLTEVGGRLCLFDQDQPPSKMGSVGRPLEAMTIEIINNEGNLAAPGESGEIMVKGPLLLEGYLGENNQATKSFATGDLGYQDAEGFVWLQGRKDDIFKSGAEKVSAFKIGQEILKSGLVADVVVVAIDDQLLGKVPCAFYVCRPETPVEAKQLAKTFRPLLAGAHLPKRWVQVERIPRTGSGKPVVRELLRLLQSS